MEKNKENKYSAQIRSIKKYIDKLRSYYILFVPSQSGITKKISSNVLIGVLFLYTIIVSFAGYLLISFVMGILYPQESTNLSDDDLSKIKILNERVMQLTGELEKLKSVNTNLKKAILLVDSSLILNSKKTKPDSNKYGGSIYLIFKRIFSGNDKENIQKSYYFIKPVEGFSTREFNPGRGHMGIDYSVKTGTPVFASAGGYVVFSDYTVNDGYMIIVNHSSEYITIYKHCSSLMKREREVVKQGEVIALSGNSGERTTGPHLHFEIWKNGLPIDPNNILTTFKE